MWQLTLVTKKLEKLRQGWPQNETLTGEEEKEREEEKGKEQKEQQQLLRHHFELCPSASHM